MKILKLVNQPSPKITSYKIKYAVDQALVACHDAYWWTNCSLTNSKTNKWPTWLLLLRGPNGKRDGKERRRGRRMEKEEGCLRRIQVSGESGLGIGRRKRCWQGGSQEKGGEVLVLVYYTKSLIYFEHNKTVNNMLLNILGIYLNKIVTFTVYFGMNLIHLELPNVWSVYSISKKIINIYRRYFVIKLSTLTRVSSSVILWMKCSILEVSVVVDISEVTFLLLIEGRVISNWLIVASPWEINGETKPEKQNNHRSSFRNVTENVAFYLQTELQ